MLEKMMERKERMLIKVVKRHTRKEVRMERKGRD